MFESTADVMKRHNLSLQSKKEVFDSEKGKEFFNGMFIFIASFSIFKTDAGNDSMKLQNGILRCLISSFFANLKE